MMLELLGLQLFNGLAHASTLFLMAAGLTLIFGVTRIVNFAHGSFYMVGALVAAHALTAWWPEAADSALTYAAAMLLGVLVCAALGALVQWLLLERMHKVPELYALVATFGLALFLHDVLLALLGPQEVFAPRFPGLKGALSLGDQYLPMWSLFLMAVGPCVWLLLHLLLTRTRWGLRVRAATQDGAMLSALGVNSRPLMLSVVMLGCALAGLGGVLQLPREPAHLQMDVNMVVETFVVVVTGGLGSISGAFWAAVLIGMVHALALSFWPGLSLVLVFATMAVVLVLRPQGLMGALHPSDRRERPVVFDVNIKRPLGRILALGLLLLALAVAVAGSDYARSVLADTLVYVLLGLSLQAMMALAGVVSFGHAAFFGLGAYGAALWLLHGAAQLPAVWAVLVALVAGVGLPLVLAALFGLAVIRSSGVYLAMLSLALAQSLWAAAVQWVDVTGGDNGLVAVNAALGHEQGLGHPVGLLLLIALVLLALAAMMRWSRSSWGAALQAQRDAPERARASGLSDQQLRYGVFVLSAGLAGLAGALWALHKGAVFPSVLSVATSVDALLVLLLGGVHQLLGALLGSAVLNGVAAELGRGFEYWRGLLGLLIMVLMIAAPEGLLSSAGWRRGRQS